MINQDTLQSICWNMNQFFEKIQQFKKQVEAETNFLNQHLKAL